MYIGSLLEVMCLDEDGVTARRKKVINRAMKDPMTRVGFVYDGTKEDFNKQRDKLLKKNTFSNKGTHNASWADFLKSKGVDPPPPPPPQIKRDSSTRASFNSIGNNDFYAVNKFAAPDLVNKDGTINWNNSTMDHETQHNIQQNVLKKIAKQNNMTVNDVIQRWNDYDKNLSSDLGASYSKSPTEFEANVAGQRRNPQATMATYNIANRILGKSTPKKEFIPSYTHGLLQSQRSQNKNIMNLSTRQYENRDYQQDLKQGAISDRTPLPRNKNMNVDKYNQRGLDIINSIKTPNRTFQLDQLDKIKGMSSDPTVNKSKNNFVKIRNKKGKVITVPDTDPRYRATQQPVQQTVTPQPSQPVQSQPSGVIQSKPYATNYNNQLSQSKPISAGSVTNRNTGITYFKKNGKLMSTAMQ